MLRHPGVFAFGQRLQVPAPLDYFLLLRNDRDQSKRPNFPQSHHRKAARNAAAMYLSSEFANNLSSANDFIRRLTLDSMPVDQCQANAGVIHGDPSSAACFARENCTT